MTLQWITPNGNLGNIADGEYFEYTVNCSNAVSYKMISGSLCTGLYFIGNTHTANSAVITKSAGTIVGIPSLSTIGGESHFFVIRAYDSANSILDRSFNIVINKELPPRINPKNVSLGSYFITEYVSTQLSSDFEGATLTWSLLGGELPPGISLSATGLLYGIINNINFYSPTTIGWSGFSYSSGVQNYGFVGWDSSAWDAQSSTPSEFNYQFTVRASDGIRYDDSVCTITIINRLSITADNTVIDVDITSILVDSTNIAEPVITNLMTTLPPIRENSDFLFQVTGFASGNTPIGFEFYNNIYPSWLTIDVGSGWVYGTAPYLTNSLINVAFTVDAFLLDNPSSKSNPVTFNFTIMQDLSNYVTWDSPNFLGNISNGATSNFEIIAHAGVTTYSNYSIFTVDEGLTTFDIQTLSFDSALKYTTGKPLKYIITNGIPLNGVYTDPRASVIIYQPPLKNKLPQGLKLLTNGLIVGKVSFRQFVLDGGNTLLDNALTSVDSVFEFNVTATDATTFTLDGSLTTFDDSLSIFDSLYSLLPAIHAEFFIDHNHTSFDKKTKLTTFYYTEQRTLLNSQQIYASNKFSIRVNHDNKNPYMDFYLTSLMSAADRINFANILNNMSLFPTEYIYRMYDPNYGKTTGLKSLFANGLTVSSALTIAENIQFNTASRQLSYGDLKNAIAINPVTGVVEYEVIYLELIDPLNVNNITRPSSYIDEKSGIVIYPPDLNNMYHRLSGVGIANANTLPLWMTSRQPDGSLLGFIRAVVLCYTKPTYSNLLLFRIKQSGYNFGNFSFLVDRYQIDNRLLTNFDLETGAFIPSTETTFDIHPHVVDTYVYQGNFDVAVDIPFDQIAGRSVAYININGGLDGIQVTSNQTLVFYTQTNFPLVTGNTVSPTFYNSPNDGWNNVDNTGNYTIEIAGYLDVLAGTANVNLRPSVWITSIDQNDIVHLSLFKQMVPGGYIVINSGNTYQNAGLYFTGSPSNTSPVPAWGELDLTQLYSPQKTTFDATGTRFINNVDSFIYGDNTDFWVKFPNTTIF